MISIGFHKNSIGFHMVSIVIHKNCNGFLMISIGFHKNSNGFHIISYYSSTREQPPPTFRAGIHENEPCMSHSARRIFRLEEGVAHVGDRRVAQPKRVNSIHPGKGGGMLQNH